MKTWAFEDAMSMKVLLDINADFAVNAFDNHVQRKVIGLWQDAQTTARRLRPRGHCGLPDLKQTHTSPVRPGLWSFVP